MTNRSILIIGLIVLALASALLGYLVAPRQESHVDFYAPAITNSGEGALVKFRISLPPGYGRTLVNVQNAKYREDTENALIKAKKNAENMLGVKLTYYDTVLDVEAIGSEVGGESAGAMFAVGIISAYSGRKINEGTTMSAGLTSNGLLFAVDGIEEKIIAAKNSGKTKFVVAKSQTIKNERDITGIEIIRVADIKQAAEQLLA